MAPLETWRRRADTLYPRSPMFLTEAIADTRYEPLGGDHDSPGEIRTSTLGCTGLTDETVPVQAAIRTLEAAGGGELVVDSPVLLNGATTQFGVTWAVDIIGDNITVRGTGRGKILRTTSGTCFFANGSGRPAGTSNWNSNRYTDATLYAITGPVTKGAVTVTCSTAAHASNFAVGDLLYLRTGQLTSNSITGWPEPDAETFRVVSVNTGTGVIGLGRPTGKSYAQEYYSVVGGSVSTTTVTAFPAPFGISNVTGRTIRNIRFENVEFDSTATDRNVISAWQVVGLRIRGCSGVGNGLQTGRDMTDVWITDNRFYCRGVTTSMPYVVAAASGTTDFVEASNVFTGDGFRYVHVHEGTVRARLLESTYLFCVADPTDKQVSFGSRTYDALIRSAQFGVCGYGVYIDGTCTGGGTLSDLRFGGAIGTAPIRLDVTNGSWRVDQVDVPTATGVATLSSGGGGAGPTKPAVLSGWIGPGTTPASSSRSLGFLPANAVITRVGVYIETAFSGGTSPALVIGIGGDTNRYMASLALTGVAAGPVPAASVPAPGNAAAGTHVPSRQQAVATLSGSPTVGRALLVLEYALVAVRP